MPGVYNSSSSAHGAAKATIYEINVVTPFLLADASGVYSAPSKLPAYTLSGLAGVGAMVFPNKPDPKYLDRVVVPGAASGTEETRKEEGDRALSLTSPGDIFIRRDGNLLATAFIITPSRRYLKKTTYALVTQAIYLANHASPLSFDDTVIGRMRGGGELNTSTFTLTSNSRGAEAASFSGNIPVTSGQTFSFLFYVESSTGQRPATYCPTVNVLWPTNNVWNKVMEMRTYMSVVGDLPLSIPPQTFASEDITGKYNQASKRSEHSYDAVTGGIRDIQTERAGDSVGVSVESDGVVKFNGNSVAKVSDRGIINKLPNVARYYVTYTSGLPDFEEGIHPWITDPDSDSFYAISSRGVSWTEDNPADIVRAEKESADATVNSETFTLTANSTAIYEISLTSRVWVTGKVSYSRLSSGERSIEAGISFVSSLYATGNNIISCGCSLQDFNPFFLQGGLGDDADGFLHGKSLSGSPVAEKTQTERMVLSKGDKLFLFRMLRPMYEEETTGNKQFNPDSARFDVMVSVRRI